MKKKNKTPNPIAKDLMTPKYSPKTIKDKRKKDPKHKKNYKAMGEAREYTDAERFENLKAQQNLHNEKAQKFHQAFMKAMKRGNISKDKLHGLIRGREEHHQLALETGQRLKELGARMKKESIAEVVLKPQRRRVTVKSPTGFVSHVGPKRAAELSKVGYVSVNEKTIPQNKDISDLIEMKLSELAEKTKRIFGEELFEQIDFFEFLEILQEEFHARKKPTNSTEKEENEPDDDNENDLKPHVIMQARKAMDMKSDPEEMIKIKFHDGDSKEVAVKHLRRANAMYNLLRPNQKEDLGNKLNASHESFMKAVGAARG